VRGFEAIGHAIAIGVGIFKIAAGRGFSGVRQAVAIEILGAGEAEGEGSGERGCGVFNLDLLGKRKLAIRVAGTGLNL
jgi:hypothetical protein